jgi:flagellar biosynthesis regulator FlbT
METTSNSVVLRNILADESCELKRMIDAFMGEKLAEFQTAVKQNVEKVVSEKISAFYTPPNPDLDDIVFSQPSESSKHIIDVCIHTLQQDRYNNNASKIEQIKKLYDQKSFSAMIGDMCGYVFKNCYLTISGNPQYAWHTPHTLPTNVLLVIKKFSESRSIQQLQQLHTDHTEYFQPNCVEFERICQQEYAEIERRKREFEESTKQSNEIIEEAHRIIDKNVSKKEYYESLEQRISQIEIEEERIREEKQKMVLIKERLLVMKQEIAREREEFEKEKKLFMEQKNKTIDIDKCFEYLL